MTGGWQRLRWALALTWAIAQTWAIGSGLPARAADLQPARAADPSTFAPCTPGFASPCQAPSHSQPRFFPRGDGDADVDRPPLPLPRQLVGCVPRRAPVPTNAEDDPSYVGSEYGLGKPSYYGFRPGLGYDDPYGRPLRYCP